MTGGFVLRFRSDVNVYKTLEEAKEILGHKNYITIKEAQEIIGYKISNKLRYRFKTYFVVVGHPTIAYLDKAEVESIKKLKYSVVPKFEAVIELSNEFNCTYNKVNHVIYKLGLKELKRTENLFNGDKDYIFKRDIQAIRDYLEDKRELENAKSIMDAYKVKIRRVPVKKGIEGILNLYNKYIHERFEDVKTLKSAVIYSDAYEIVMNIFNKEFEQYSEESIDGFVTFVTNNAGYSRLARYEFVMFINYVIESLKIEDRQLYEYTRRINNTNKTGKVIGYSQEQYLELFGLLHRGIHNRAFLKEAIENRLYAQAWLYMYLHYIMIWRTGDILDIPGPNLSHLFSTEFHDGESFLRWLSDENNIFTDEMGIIMCEDVKHKIDTFRIKTNKTNENLVMEIGQLTAPVAGLLFAICEAHRQIVSKSGHRLFNSKNILTLTTTSSDIFKTIFDGKVFDILGENFSNRRANKSYNNYIHNYSEESGSCFAAHIISILRGYRDEVSETTTIYETRKADGTIDAIVSRLFDLGSFCFAKLKFIGLSDASVTELNYEKQDEVIKSLDITPFQAELAVKGIHTQRERITKLIAKMMVQPEVIKKIMGQLAFGDTHAKHNHTKCLLKAILNSKADNIENIESLSFIENFKEYRNGTNCMYPESDTCFGCSMLIGEMYFLYELNDAFIDAIKSLETCENEYECYMYSNIIKSYKSILKEAQITLGKDKVNLFVNTRFINEELKRLDKSQKLILTLTGGKDDNGSKTNEK
jgi:hypothetical protein